MAGSVWGRGRQMGNDSVFTPIYVKMALYGVNVLLAC